MNNLRWSFIAAVICLVFFMRAILSGSSLGEVPFCACAEILRRLMMLTTQIMRINLTSNNLPGRKGNYFINGNDGVDLIKSGGVNRESRYSWLRLQPPYGK